MAILISHERGSIPVGHDAPDSRTMSVGDAIQATCELIRLGRVLLIGELRGTYEFPALVAGLAAESARQGLGVLIGIEVPRSEQESIDEFLASDGAPDSIAALTSGSFWHQPSECDDGRSSKAILNLLCALRAIRPGRDVSVCAFDLPWGALGEPRDRAMATRLVEAIAKNRNAMTIVLAGNEHTRITTRRHDATMPLGEYLNREFGDLVALIGHNQGGTVRAATSQGEAEQAPLYADVTPIGQGWFANAMTDGHHGWVNVGVVSAAPPLSTT